MFPFNYNASVPLPGLQQPQQEQEESDEDDPTIWNSANNKNVLQFHGNERTMNINPLILTNVQGSPYFKVELFALKTFHEVVDQIYYKVDHLEPWATGSRKTAGRSQTGMCGGVRGVSAGGIVSSCYCLLYKLFTLKLTKKQVVALINHTDSPYIRGVGFMYLRYTLPPGLMWDWFEPYLDDEEEIDIKAGGGKPMTMGEMCRLMLTRLEWFDTRFPRIAVNVEKQIREQLEQRNKEQEEWERENRHKKESQNNHSAKNRSSPADSKVRSSRDRSRERDRKSKNRSSSRDRRSRSRGKRSRSKNRKSRSKDRKSRSRERKSRSRDRKSRSRDRRSKSKERKSRARSSSRDRDRRNRSSSRDRKDRIRDKSRSRDRKKKERKDRSRSRDRHHKKHKKDRSRERRRSRSRDSKESKHRGRDVDDYSQELKKFKEDSSKIKQKSRRSRSRS